MNVAYDLNRPRPLYSSAGLAELERLTHERTLYAFDFDGTLAPIVTMPDHARMTTPMNTALARLATRVPVAIVTGRSLADIGPRLPHEIQYVVGNHGNEGLPNGGPDPVAALAVCAEWKQQLTERLRVEQRWPGVLIEEKGISLTLHYRLAQQREVVEAELMAAIGALMPPPRVVAGKLVLNLLPEDGLTKREALEQLTDHLDCTHALFIGDDVTDEYVFIDAPPEWITIRVEPVRDTAARWFVNSQLDVLRLLLDLQSMLR